MSFPCFTCHWYATFEGVCLNPSSPLCADFPPYNLLDCRYYEPLTARIAGIVPHSFVDGPGTRFVVFFQGCPHNCPDCQNPETHDPNGGNTVLVSDIISQICTTRYLDGITLSGGDPLMQPQAVIAIADAAHRLGLDVWCYTGWTIETIPDNAKEALYSIDTLVDGPYIKDLPPALYRGSENQRIIEVKEWLEQSTPTN